MTSAVACEERAVGRSQVRDHPMRSAAECRAWVEAHFTLLHHIIKAVCRAGHVSQCDEADFMGVVLLKLVDRDYAVLRQFDGRSTLKTFLHKVVKRQLLDWRDAQWGKWRPSAGARTRGDVAVQLERLTLRDGLPVADAIGILAARPWGLSSGDLRHLHAQLPRPRAHRTRQVPLTQDIRAASDRADATVERQHLESGARLISIELSSALASLQGDDRRLLRMRFQDGMSIRDIASEIGVDPKRLYRRFSALLGGLRARLERRHLTKVRVRPLLGHSEVTLAPLMSQGSPTSADPPPSSGPSTA